MAYTLKSPLVFVQDSPVSGKGLFARVPISAGQAVLDIHGRIYKSEYVKDRTFDYPNAIAIDYNVWVIPAHNSTWKYINHSCDPNSYIKRQNQLAAIRNIKAGEELTIDYSLTEADPFWSMDQCSCGAVNCRKIILSYPNLPPDTKKLLAPFAPDFMKR